MQEFIKTEIEKKQWVYRVLDGQKESENVIFNNDDFMVLPDSEGIDEPSVLNWILIFKDTKLLSMRNLRGEHLPMLRSVNDIIAGLLPPEFSRPMLYFHHPASVYQLHLHCTAPNDTLRTTSSMQRVVFLQDIISNLTIDPDFYAKATMTYVLPASHEIVQMHTRPDGIFCRS